MSQHGIVNVTCPSCDAEGLTDIWNSINVQIDPDAKTELLNGRINIFECNKCGYKEAMPVELFYHDMANQYCIQLFPIPSFYWNNSFDRFNEDGKLNMKLLEGSIPDYFRDTRIVFSIDEMNNYITFRHRLALHKGINETPTQEQRGIKLLTGICGSPGFVTGVVRNIEETPETTAEIIPGEIIVMKGAVPYREFSSMDCVKQALAFVTDEGGMTCSIAIVTREYGIPAITGTKVGSVVLKTGQKIIVDATRGIVYSCE